MTPDPNNTVPPLVLTDPDPALPTGHAGGEKAVESVQPRTIPQDETDGRAVHEWQSRYLAPARLEIRVEAFAVAAILFAVLAMIFALWSGLMVSWLGCDFCRRPAFTRYGYFFLGGLLGGTLFGIKYLYHVVARGFWNQDRRLWRFLSPWLAGSLALVVGALTDAGFLGLTISANKGSAYLSLGFISGYFGDKALAKMTEMADVIFGTRDNSKSASRTTSTTGQ